MPFNSCDANGLYSIIVSEQALQSESASIRLANRSNFQADASTVLSNLEYERVVSGRREDDRSGYAESD